jgi:hypothetical protein
VNPVRIGYSLEMQYFNYKNNFTSKEQKRTDNQNYHLKSIFHEDKKVRILVNKCDLCNNTLPQTEDNVRLSLESCMKIIDEIDDSFESDYDKSTYECGPKLFLCDYCQKEYLLPAY